MKKPVIAVIGLGYVGLPLAVEFAKQYKTIGCDISTHKIEQLRNCIDPCGEICEDVLRSLDNLVLTDDLKSLSTADVIVVAVPTPVDGANTPDFSPLINASKAVGAHMKKGALVIYESTVYPGATEEVCIPVLEQSSGMKWMDGFNVGYSPERVNPGDRERTITKIVKVVSGDNEATLSAVVELYESIITAGVHRASSIKVAEASKVIENVQRDLNIALMNELSIIFEKMGIDTLQVLQASGTKWNFLPFRPGLVGGHCIGVDPYYLTHKAELLGYHPQVILAGRRINDGMASYAAKMTVKNMISLGGCNRGDTVVVLGLTFKEDCPDLRNSKVADLIRHLEGYGLNVIVHDPIASPLEAEHEYRVKLTPWEELPKNASAVVAAVSHRQYLEMPMSKLLSLLKPNGVFTDVKSAYDPSTILNAGHAVWRL